MKTGKFQDEDIRKGDSTDVESPFGEYKIKDDPYAEYNLDHDNTGADRSLEENEDEPVVEYIYNESEKEIKDKQSQNVFAIFFKILINPVNGWKAIRKSSLTSGDLVTRLFIPFCLLAAASQYVEMIYDPLINFAQASVSGIITFFIFFLSYYLAIILSTVLLPKVSKQFPRTRFGEMMTIVCITSLALFHAFSQLLWFLNEILAFLPLWTIYLIFKGMGFVKINENKSTYTLGVECVVILCSPLVMEWLFSFVY